MKLKSIVLKIFSYLGYLFFWIPAGLSVNIVSILAWMFASGRSTKRGLTLLLLIENKLYHLTSKLAHDYDNGLHPKHRLTGYHDFFLDNLKKGETVIDIGCGNGALAYDLAKKSKVTAVDLNEEALKEAEEKFAHPSVQYIHGDILKDLPKQSFDVAVLSNVLEHIPKRVEFLKKAQARLQPKRWLIRVPLYERDWRIPLMDELGIDYRLDATHYIEYRPKQFEEEINKSGLKIVHQEIHYGEIWCEVSTKNKAKK